MSPSSLRTRLLLLPFLLALPIAGAAAQVPVPVDSLVRVPIAGRYAAGWLRRTLFGREYRELWGTPISVPVLDLATTHGGMTPISKGGGQQTSSLRLRAADGQDYYFRSIDKDPTPNLPPELLHTVVAGVVQDQTSSAHPTAPLIVGPLLAAAGVLHGEPELFILPDDPRLGEYRAQFAGLVGMLEPRIAAPVAGQSTWGGASEIIQGDSLFARVARSADDRVDVRALLKARIVDLLVGDWDRHRDQWSWVRFGDGLPRRWVPVPRDRDFAMVHYDGLLLGLARYNFPQLISFGPEYPGVLGLTWNGRELDRQFLPEIERSAWDTVVAEVQAAVTDAVIDAAVHRLPPEHYALIGAEITAALRRRRDALPEVAGRFYRMLVTEAEVYGSDDDEVAEVRTPDARTVEVSLARRAGGDPYLRRQFVREETKEIRLFLKGGDDSVLVQGPARSAIRLRVIGGSGTDVVLDSSRSGKVRMYDVEPGTVTGRGVSLDRRPYTPPPKRTPTEIPVRDWGVRWHPGILVAGGPDVGLLVGLSRTVRVYGFRKLPYASRHRFRAGVATGPWSYQADYLGEFRRESSPNYTQIALRASGIDVLRFHGFGNEQPASGASSFYRVTQHSYSAAAAVVLRLGQGASLTFGPTLRYVNTDKRPNRFLGTISPYGDGAFGQVGGHAALALDSRGLDGPRSRGAGLTVGGSAYPAWWDVRRAYGEIHGEVEGYLDVPVPLAPVLVVHAGGKHLWGPYPYFDAAFIGKYGTVRLGRENRYAGDASVYVNSELRLSLGEAFLGAPGEFGILGLADAGRVFLEGEDSRTWHGAAGGGVWVSLLDRTNILSVAVAKSEERTAVYFQAGFGF